MNKHKKDERKRRALVALLQAKAYFYKTGRIRGDKFFRDQNLTSINKIIIYDIADRDITDEYVAEVLAREYAYKHGKMNDRYHDMLARAVDAERKWVEDSIMKDPQSPAIAPQTGAESPRPVQPMNCPPEQQNAVERGIFDLDEQTCIEFLKSRGWQFLATKAI